MDGQHLLDVSHLMLEMYTVMINFYRADSFIMKVLFYKYNCNSTE